MFLQICVHEGLKVFLDAHNVLRHAAREQVASNKLVRVQENEQDLLVYAAYLLNRLEFLLILLESGLVVRHLEHAEVI